MRAFLTLALLALSGCVAPAYAAGTINLPSGPYCATTQTAGAYDGVTAGACATTAPPSIPGAGCPAVAHTPWGDRALVTRSSITYGATGQRARILDITSWDGLLGFGETSIAATPWPGVGGAAPVIRAFPRSGYICAKFRSPSNVATRVGGFSNPSYLRALSPTLTMSISRNGGDFAGGLDTPGCLVRNVYASDSNLAQWKGTVNNPTGSCNLQPNTDYYLNITFGDAPGCSTATCALGIVSYHN